jgi:hypothetical protein
VGLSLNTSKYPDSSHIDTEWTDKFIKAYREILAKSLRICAEVRMLLLEWVVLLRAKYIFTQVVST